MFIEIVPYKKKFPGNAKNVLRVSFMRLKDRFILKIFIGLNIAKEFNITKEDKISLLYEKENNKTFLIKKAQTSVGYSLLETKDYFRTQLIWNSDILDPTPFLGMREVEYNKYEDGIRFYIK